jgi:ketosteroid isomerase-like protein
MTVEENKQIVGHAFQALMDGNLTPLGGLLGDDAVLHQCGFLHPLPARQVLQGEMPGWGRILDREARLERMVGEGDFVALHWRTSGRIADPASSDGGGTRVSFPSMTFVRLEEGRIAEIWNIQDVATLQSQLGEYD